MIKQEQIKTPELNKILTVKDNSQTIGEFLEWLSEQGIILVEYIDNGRSGEFFETGISRERLLAKYYDIDLAKCETERSALLDAVREDNKLEGVK